MAYRDEWLFHFQPERKQQIQNSEFIILTVSLVSVRLAPRQVTHSWSAFAMRVPGISATLPQRDPCLPRALSCLPGPKVNLPSPGRAGNLGNWNDSFFFF